MIVRHFVLKLLQFQNRSSIKRIQRVASFCSATSQGNSEEKDLRKPSGSPQQVKIKGSEINIKNTSSLKGFKLNRENVWTIPNLLCIARMGMAPVLGYMIVNSQFVPAFGVLAVAGLTDLLDGWIARFWPGQSSVMGSFLDPMADKILVGSLFISLTYIGMIPVALTSLIIGRDAFLIGAGFYIRYLSLPPPRTLSRYFDVTSPTAQLAPTFISKINTGVQLTLIGTTLLSTVFPLDQSYLVTLWYCTAGSTILSALSYVFVKDTYKVLKQPSQNPEQKNNHPKKK